MTPMPRIPTVQLLVDRSGEVQARYASLTKPEAIARDIEALL